MAFTYRLEKGSPLTEHELDDNFRAVANIAQTTADEINKKVTADTNEAKKQADEAKKQADAAKSEADRASQITGLDTVADAIGLAAVPFPDVWIPFNDSLRMFAGYGREVKVGDDVVARMVNFECSTTRTYIDKSGVLRTAAINEPRFEKQGLLIEGQSTNYMAFSEKAWTRTGGAQMSVGINGFFSMPAGDSIQFRDNSATMWPAGLNCTMSIYVIGSGKLSLETSIYGAFSSGVSVEIDLDSMTVSDNSKGFVTKISERLYRVGIFVITNATPSPSTGKGLYINQVGVNTDISVNFCQLEALPFASSYIHTNGTAVTRAADFPKLSRWGNDNYYAPITIACEVDAADGFADTSVNSRRGIFSGYPSVGAYEVLMIDPSTKKAAFAYGNATFIGNGEIPIVADGATHVVGARFDGIKNSVFSDGVVRTSGVDSVPVFGNDNGEDKNWLLIGYGAGGSVTRHLFGHIRNFRIWHHALSDVQIKGLK